ncbi:related to RKM3 - ribosomal lysine methyltransferase [Ustilago trichophora]|uniref:Related to RKM3 - ribosomal lysine methyltransferase n=1 Tax=Ustilago trichophora TaxID=86804 RepID=A0A5C3DNI3_9BASI|nr:related to RKM3 - ribosomal lysine methyltransferase [Ustilago trichophora]
MSDASTSSVPPRASKRQRLQRKTQSHSTSASEASSTPATSCSPAPTVSTSKASQPATLTRFLEWCASQDITISPNLDLRYTGDHISWSISCHARSPIAPDTVIATIPKTAVLSRKTSALSPLLKGKYLSDSHETVGLELALCLLYERCLGSKSAFEPFLSILPRLPVPLPFLRDSDAPASSSSPWRWIAGTEASRIDTRASFSHLASSTSSTWTYDHDYGMCKSKALSYFYDVAIPILSRSRLFDTTQKQHLDALERAFLTAYTHVSSRDFIVDTFHGVALVPVADLFNHAETHTVQFESDQDVCEVCGVALLTGHEEGECRQSDVESGDVSEEEDCEEEDAKSDEDDENLHVDQHTSEEVETSDPPEDINQNEVNDESESESNMDEEDPEYSDTLDMRTLHAIPCDQEIYNTYGPLSNALLLTRYGFCLDTETDVERFTVDLRFPDERSSFFAAFLGGKSCSSVGFKKVDEVRTVFEQVLSLVAEQFPNATSENSNTEEEAKHQEQEIHNRAIDNLFRLETPLPSTPHWSLSTLTPLFHPNASTTEPIDQDLIDRDEITPLFLSSTGRISIPLFTLTYLMHRIRSDRTPSTLVNILATDFDQNNSLVQESFATLHTFCSLRLHNLHLTQHLEEGLNLLEPDQIQVQSIEKASIHHAYQEHAALQSALASLDQLITST